MSDTLVKETNELRLPLLSSRKRYADIRFLRGLADELSRTKELSRQPVVQCLRTKAHINERRDNQIFSLFDASYFPSLALDFLSYRPLNVVGERFAEKFKSHTNPVTIEHMSEGFTAPVVVALFPENHIDNLQEQDDTIFYFIDKFVVRHNRITRRLLENIVCPAAFPLVRGATHLEVERASSHWVWLHEYHHRQGDMPLPKYLGIKVSKKALSGLEELRVDMSALLALRGDCGLSDRDAELTYQFILSERLLRYAIEGIPHPNYDAVASQLLFNYLREHDGIRVKDRLLYLGSGLHDVLTQFVANIGSIERLIHRHEESCVAAELLAFTNRYTNYDPVSDDYRHIDFFLDVKQRLNL
jgi:hypothetical protein